VVWGADCGHCKAVAHTLCAHTQNTHPFMSKNAENGGGNQECSAAVQHTRWGPEAGTATQITKHKMRTCRLQLPCVESVGVTAATAPLSKSTFKITVMLYH
jgi:hypothetical protein